MALQSRRIFSVLCVTVLASVMLMLLWGFSGSSSWSSFSGFRPGDGSLSFAGFKLWDSSLYGNLNTTRESKLNESAKADHKMENKIIPETPMPPLDIKSYKKLPVWDFEDVYNQDAPPRPNICAKSLRNSQDEKFKKAFLPNIRMFMHKDNVNMSEWNRLSHFNNPFGFMSFQYNEVMDVVKLIPEPKDPLFPPKPGSDGCVRCAVVGTAGILNGSRMGKEINGHDYVIRMNGAVIKGHEDDVGNRTDVYVHTSHSITASIYFFKKYGYRNAPNDKGIKYVMIPEGMRDFNWLQGLLKRERIASGSYRNTRPWTYYGDGFDKSRFYVLHPDFLRYVRNRFLRSRNLNATYWAIVRPTNGAFTLFLALQMCDSVSAYGFITEDFKNYNNYYFENDVKTHVIFYSNHDYILEKNTWKQLHDAKIMKLYQRQISEKDKGTG